MVNASSLNIRSLVRRNLLAVLFFASLSGISVFGEEATPTAGSEFVDVRQIEPTIMVDLRYAGTNNIIRRPLYPAGMPALVRLSVAHRLAFAQEYLRARGYGLKIWDAYRPTAAQKQLWQATRNNSFVADPKEGVGSMHTRGTAVDTTLVDKKGRDVPMPTDFDEFTPAALLYYRGPNPAIRSNLNLLQKAMARAGFYGSRTEWWHFCAADWTNYQPVPEVQVVAQAPRRVRGPLMRFFLGR